MSDFKKAKQEAVQSLLQPNSNVLGIGIGIKGAGGEEDCLRVYVSDERAAVCQRLIPPDFSGVPTRIAEVGRFGRSGYRPKSPVDLHARLGSPIRVSTTAPNVNEGQRGTLGAVIKDGDGNLYILSCNHVLTVNGRVRTDPDAQVVSAEFVGQENPLGSPGNFVPFRRDQGNSVDCAVAQIADHSSVHPSFLDDLQMNATAAVYPAGGMDVEKVGAATGPTKGKIIDIDADLYIDYSFGTFRFDHQIMIDGGSDKLEEAFATAGDSGSLVVDSKSKQPTALIYAASGRFAVACPLRTDGRTGVLDQLEGQLKKPLSFVTQ